MKSDRGTYIGIRGVFRLDEDSALAGRGHAVDTASSNGLLVRSHGRSATSLRSCNCGQSSSAGHAP